MFISIFVRIILGNSYSKYNIILIMTGEEFFNLKRGSNVTVETPFGYFTKGQVLKVEYIDSLHQQVFLRDTSKKLGDQVKMVDDILFMLEFFVVGGKLPEKKNDKVLELPFKVGDKVWFIVENEVHEGTLTKCDITINKDDTRIYYNVLYYNHIHCSVVAKGIASNKLFKTKEELLKSL